MKKIIYLLAFILVLVGCQNQEDTSGVVLSLKEGQEIKQGPITFVFENHSDTEVGYGRPFELYDHNDQLINLKDGVYTTLELYHLLPNESGEIEADLNNLYDPLEEGDYYILYPLYDIESNETADTTRVDFKLVK